MNGDNLTRNEESEQVNGVGKNGRMEEWAGVELKSPKQGQFAIFQVFLFKVSPIPMRPRQGFSILVRCLSMGDCLII